MKKFIVGKKIEMTQIYNDSGNVVPVTVVDIQPCVVTQVKNKETDGYIAVQVGYGVQKKSRIAKPQQGHTKDVGYFAGFKEFRTAEEYKVGDKIDVSQFELGDEVKVSGVSKGKGFQGVVKRYGFKGAPKSHGTKDQVRMPGSIGATGPQRVFKGTRMGGQMGNQGSTVSNLTVEKIDIEKNQVYLRGAVPGARNSLVTIYCN
ncbi:MAG: 50S ribosomal protein L3 [bacterium]|nr:50S ribosomal protein L3 [bacterium]